MNTGYARVSTGEQICDLQPNVLTKDGCDKVPIETASGPEAEQPILQEALAHAHPGGTLVVWRLDGSAVRCNA